MSTARPLVPSYLPGPALAEPRSVGGLLALSMRRPGGRRAVSAVTVLLLLAGVSVLAFPTITDFIGQHRQHQLTQQFNTPQYQTIYRNHDVKVGQGLTRLIINNPRVKVNTLVVEGTTVAALRAGAGHYPSTPLPCQQGNVGIAGHRTTYSRPFNRIDEMRAGDTVMLVTPIDECTYRVVSPFAPYTSNPFVVLPNDLSVVAQDGELGTGHWLTMTSCHPKGSAARRIILRLAMISHRFLPAKHAKGSS